MSRPDTFLAGVSMSPTHRCVPDLARSAIDTAVTRTYVEHGGSLTNAQLYEAVAKDLGVQMELVAGASEGRSYNANARAARWSQQTLKTQGLIERVDRGRWRITAEGKNKLRRPVRGLHLVAFSTGLGVAVWGECRDVVDCLDEDITLCVTSSPYPIAQGRAYGRIEAHHYVDWLCGVLEGVVARGAERLRQASGFTMTPDFRATFDSPAC